MSGLAHGEGRERPVDGSLTHLTDGGDASLYLPATIGS